MQDKKNKTKETFFPSLSDKDWKDQLFRNKCKKYIGFVRKKLKTTEGHK